MRFFINSITSHTEKSNVISYKIIDTGTILDGCDVRGYAPKSLELVAGIAQEIPFFIVNGIFGFNRPKNIKLLEKQLQAKAPKGQKRVWRAKAKDIFDEISKLNVEPTKEEKEPTGLFLGEVNEKIIVIIKKIECIYSQEWTGSFGWRHNGHNWERPSGTKCMWKLEDGDGNILMLSSSGDVTNHKFYEMSNQGPVVIEAVVTQHKVFRNTRQTWIKNVKFNPGGLFGLLS